MAKDKDEGQLDLSFENTDDVATTPVEEAAGQEAAVEETAGQEAATSAHVDGEAVGAQQESEASSPSVTVDESSTRTVTQQSTGAGTPLPEKSQEELDAEEAARKDENYNRAVGNANAGNLNIEDVNDLYESGDITREQYQKLAYAVDPNLRPDVQERQARRARNNALISAIGDGVSAMANLYYTSRGAPGSRQTPALSDVARDRYDDVLKRRQSSMNSYATALQNARALRLGREKEDRAYRNQMDQLIENNRFKMDLAGINNEHDLKKQAEQLAAEVQKEQIKANGRAEVAKINADAQKTVAALNLTAVGLKGKGQNDSSPFFVGEYTKDLEGNSVYDFNGYINLNRDILKEPANRATLISAIKKDIEVLGLDGKGKEDLRRKLNNQNANKDDIDLLISEYAGISPTATNFLKELGSFEPYTEGLLGNANQPH